MAKDYILSNTNINTLGYGVDRIVIEDPSTGHAVKISCDSDYNQNKTESQIYSQVSKKSTKQIASYSIYRTKLSVYCDS